jgi:hypothetical protein
MGWLAMHPKMQALGLGHDESGTGLTFKGGDEICYWHAASRLFNIPYRDARNLFRSAGFSKYDEGVGSLQHNHKALFQHRVKAFLGEHGQL